MEAGVRVSHTLNEREGGGMGRQVGGCHTHCMRGREEAGGRVSHTLHEREGGGRGRRVGGCHTHCMRGREEAGGGRWEAVTYCNS